MMLTPLFTSPLDTAIGLERTTCQLIDVEVKDGEYVFGFEKLKRWIDLCKKCGIEYFEICSRNGEQNMHRRLLQL